MTAVRVDLGERSYDVHVGRGLLGDVAGLAALPGGAGRAALVTQAPVALHHLEPVADALRAAGLEVRVLEIPDGEAAKSIDVATNIWQALADWPLRRRDVIVALGGGVVGDLAGFAAATWHRGVEVVHLPTTLLAQVDAAIGGKTAIDLAQGKNLVGAFHQPRAVVADMDVLATLPPRIRTEGLGEVVKYGLIRDPVILDVLEAHISAVMAGDLDVFEQLVLRSVAVKAAVVSADEREGGERAHLNFGHTFGHALEALTGYEGFLHGEAVAVGTCLALRLGVRLGMTPPAVAERGEALLERLGLPTRTHVLDRDEVWAVMGRDKKAADGVRFVLLDDVGRPRLLTPPRDDVDAVLTELEITL